MDRIDITHESQGVVGLGTIISIKEDEDFIRISEPTDITGPLISQEYVDFTHMQSKAGYKEQKPTWKSSGTISFQVHRVNGDPGQEAVIKATNAIPTELRRFKVEYPDNSVFLVSAYPSYSFTAPISGAFDMAITLTISGPVVNEDTEDIEEG